MNMKEPRLTIEKLKFKVTNTEELNGFIQAWFLKYCEDPQARCETITNDAWDFMKTHRSLLTPETCTLITNTLKSCKSGPGRHSIVRNTVMCLSACSAQLNWPETNSY